MLALHKPKIRHSALRMLVQQCISGKAMLHGRRTNYMNFHIQGYARGVAPAGSRIASGNGKDINPFRPRFSGSHLLSGFSGGSGPFLPSGFVSHYSNSRTCHGEAFGGIATLFCHCLILRQTTLTTAGSISNVTILAQLNI